MYRIVPDPATITQVAALPADALDAYAEVLEVLQLTQWNGRPQHEDNPEGAVRRWNFGVGQAGQVVYLAPFAEARATLRWRPGMARRTTTTSRTVPCAPSPLPGRAGRHRVLGPGRSPPGRHLGSCLAGLNRSAVRGRAKGRGGRWGVDGSDTQAAALRVARSWWRHGLVVKILPAHRGQDNIQIRMRRA